MTVPTSQDANPPLKCELPEESRGSCAGSQWIMCTVPEAMPVWQGDDVDWCCPVFRAQPQIPALALLACTD